jgi:hypothetical protein
MLLMCLPFVIYTAGMQMFLDSLGGAAAPRYVRVEDDR